MDPLLANSTDRSPLPSGSPPSIGGTILTLLAFFALAAVALFVVTYPVASVVLLATAVVLAGVARNLAQLARRHRGSLRRIDVPGIGTVEYRVVRSRAD
ncbi:hypothetical protein [Halorubrum tibetense]|uniref:Uncharacterized protein n=1 Tax=Halorubrum tibetense TaxID=175631 RepID=A0ABD5SCG1_9EURY